MNISKGNMYPWITHTWNTIKGTCPHDCSYCYMKRWSKLNPVRFDEKELKTNLGNGNFIFVGSSCDMFAKNIPMEYIYKTLIHCEEFDNNYLFQSKNPKRIYEYDVKFGFESKIVLCITVETNRWYPEIMNNCPKPQERINYFGQKLSDYDKYITIEPIMDFDLKELIQMIKIIHPVQVNIGADSGNNDLPEPESEKILELINELKKFTIVEKKKNLKRLYS